MVENMKQVMMVNSQPHLQHTTETGGPKHRKSTSDTETDLLLSSPETSLRSTATESVLRSQNGSTVPDFLEHNNINATTNIPDTTTHSRNPIADPACRAQPRKQSCPAETTVKNSAFADGQREGEWWEQQEDLDQAVRVYKRCLATCKASQVRKSIEGGNMHHSIGRIQWKRGDYRDCMLHYDRAISIFEHHATATLDLVDVFISKGQAHVSQGLMGEAKHCFRCALTALAAIPEDGCNERSDLLHGRTHHGMAQVHEASGSLDRALHYCHDALDWLKRGQRDASIAAASTLLTQGSIYEKQKLFEFSLGCFEEAYTIYIENQSSTADLASALAHIGWVHYRQHDFTHAIRLYKQALRTIHQHRTHGGGGRRPNRNEATILVQLALAMAQQEQQQHCGHSSSNNRKKAGRHLRRALSIQTQLLGGSHPDVATTLAAMSNVTTDIHEAFGLLDRAFRIRMAALGSQHVVVGVTLLGLGRLYAQLRAAQPSSVHYDDDSFRCFVDALMIFRSNGLDPQDDRVVEAESLLRQQQQQQQLECVSAAHQTTTNYCADHDTFPVEKSLLCAFT